MATKAPKITSPRPAILDLLLRSEEPSVRWRTRREVLGEKLSAKQEKLAAQEIRESQRVQRLLSERDAHGRIPRNAYSKWSGAHWVLVALAELGYPPGDRALSPLVDQMVEFSLALPKLRIAELAREHGSIPGNALYAMYTLGIVDRTAAGELAARLLDAQWPDGGWNCDRHRDAKVSSFTESLIPLRGLALHARATGDRRARAAVERAKELFLERRLFRRKTNGRIIHASFVKLHYPCYWHYDVLFALKVMAELGALSDPRCSDPIAWLEKKRLADGGFAAEAKYYASARSTGSRSLVDWGGVRPGRANVWVTVDALSVLRRSGRSSAQRRALAG